MHTAFLQWDIAVRSYAFAATSLVCRSAIACLELLLNPLVDATDIVTLGLQRRWRRERRRRAVGRAYDMALEIARFVPRRSDVLDVGCGNGFIAHHLAGLLGSSVIGLDVRPRTDAPIEYLSYNGVRFPVETSSFDVVLLCYVLHHASNQAAFLEEVSRVLRRGGVVVIYEDMPERKWDKAVCKNHDRAWRHRTGPCTFRLSHEWKQLFVSSGFEVTSERKLSRWRNLFHPVSRRMYVLRAADKSAG